MQPHQQRVVTEKEELDTKIFALGAFIGGSDIFKSLGSDEQQLLYEQEFFMKMYSEILGERIAAFKD